MRVIPQLNGRFSSSMMPPPNERLKWGVFGALEWVLRYFLTLWFCIFYFCRWPIGSLIDIWRLTKLVLVSFPFIKVSKVFYFLWLKPQFASEYGFAKGNIINQKAPQRHIFDVQFSRFLSNLLIILSDFAKAYFSS